MSAQRFQETLENGLELLVEVLPKSKSACIGFFVKTGSRDETKSEAGVSHFLEHMMFKGTAKRSALDITYELGNLAAQSNAYTSDEMTVYYATVLPKYFGHMQELLSDMLRPSIDPAEFDMEKKVILEEIALYQDRPTFYLFENALRLFFDGHSAGNSVLGSTQSVSAISHEMMRDYFARRYHPSNICLVVTGNVDIEEVRSAARTYCGSWKRGSTEREIRPHQYTARQEVLKKDGINTSHVLFAVPSAPVEDEEARVALAVLSVIIGDSSGSKLYWELVDPGIADSAGADSEEKEGCGVFSVYASFLPERRDQVIEILKKVIARPDDFSDEDLERAKTKMLTSLILEGELPMGRMMAIGSEWTYHGRFHDLDRDADRVRSVTRKTILQALEKYPFGDWSTFELQTS